MLISLFHHVGYLEIWRVPLTGQFGFRLEVATIKCLLCTGRVCTLSIRFFRIYYVNSFKCASSITTSSFPYLLHWFNDARFVSSFTTADSVQKLWFLSTVNCISFIALFLCTIYFYCIVRWEYCYYLVANIYLSIVILQVVRFYYTYLNLFICENKGNQ